MRALKVSMAAMALVGIAGCGDDGPNPPATCKVQTDCPSGQYCGAAGTCISDCKADKDCKTGKCNTSIGKCTTVQPDAGPFEGGVADLPPKTPDQKPPTPDTAPKPDTSVTPDSKPAPDTKPALDVTKVEAAPTPEASVKDGPKADLAKADGPKADLPKSDLPKGDLKKVDALQPDGQPPTCATLIGKPCTAAGAECGTVATCLLTTATAGVCTCPCTPDNPQTPLVNEDNCPNLAKNACGRVLMSNGTTQSFCFQTCAPKFGANDCQATLACDPASGASVGLSSKAVCLFTGCTQNTQCPVITATVCSVAQQNCTAGKSCVTYVGGDEGRCVSPGACDLPSGLCKDHSLGLPTAKVGDPCKDDTECASNMRCMMQYNMATYQKKSGACQDDDECCSGVCQSGQCVAGLCPVLYRNGYCVIRGCQFASTLTTRACPTGSTCNRLYSGGMCQKTCSLTAAVQCRGYTTGAAFDYLGDYECRAWNNLQIGMQAIADDSVCDFGPSVPCDIFAGTSLNCSALGLTPNSTNMSCRTLGNQATTNLYDPQGFCLDDTASGSTLRANPFP